MGTAKYPLEFSFLQKTKRKKKKCSLNKKKKRKHYNFGVRSVTIVERRVKTNARIEDDKGGDHDCWITLYNWYVEQATPSTPGPWTPSEKIASTSSSPPPPPYNSHAVVICSRVISRRHALQPVSVTPLPPCPSSGPIPVARPPVFPYVHVAYVRYNAI